ncbi:MAG: DUF4238 domain-containing protein [Caulobacteraceae bacterium]
MKPNPPHKHHYLPEFYTRRWTSEADGKMVRYWRKPSGEIERRCVAPGGIGFQDHLYTIPEQEDDRATYSLEEELFRLVDDHGSTCLEGLLRGEIPSTGRARSKWTAFILSLAFRTPKDLLAAKNAFKLLSQTMFPDTECSDVSAEQMAKQNLWNSINNKVLGNVIINMEWDIISLVGKYVNVMTSDNPLVMSNGLKKPDGNYSLALSPKHIFVCSWNGPVRSEALRASPKILAKTYNRYVVQRAREYVIAADDRSRHFVEKHLGTDRIPSPIELLVDRYRAEQGGPTPPSPTPRTA